MYMGVMHYKELVPDSNWEQAITCFENALQKGCEDLGPFIEVIVKANKKDPAGGTFLHNTCTLGMVNITKLLLDKGANPNAVNNSNQTPLHLASGAGYLDIVKLLKVASIDAIDIYFKTPFHYACQQEHFEIAEFLLAHGANIEAIAQGETALIITSKSNHPETGRFLIAKKARLDAVNDSNQTALHLTCWAGHLNIVKLLKEANMEDKDTDYMTPFHYACQKEHFEVAEFLLIHGANSEATSQGETALIIASKQYYLLPTIDGFVEGKNNRIKTIKRVAYGYRSMDNFRLRILATNSKEAGL